MRLAEDSSSWKARGIIRRDFRHTHGEPEVPKGHPKRKQKTKKPKTRLDHKHIWVEVGYREYQRYASKVLLWWYGDFRATYTTYFVCAECLDTKTKHDKAKERVIYRKRACACGRARQDGW